MFEVMTGKIEFYPGGRVLAQTSVKAPSLRQKQITQRSAFTSKQEIMNEIYVDLKKQKDLADIMKLIRMDNTPDQEA